MCEHLALQTLREAGLPAARTQIFTGAGRVFLESERFDRTVPQTSTGQAGRLGMVSLQVYDAEYVGEMDNWAASWCRAILLAATFWQAAAHDARVSTEFRAIAIKNLSHIGL